MKNFKKILVAVGLFASVAVFAQCSVANLSAWSSVVNPDARLDVTAVSAMGGTPCGLQSSIDFDNKHYVQDDSPSAEQRYRGAFCIDPNSIIMPSSGTFRRLKIMNVRCPGPGAGGTCPFRQLMQMKLQNNAGSYNIQGFIRDGAGLPNNGSSKNGFDFDITDAPTRIEWDLNITTGQLRLWANATTEADTPVITKNVTLTQWADGVDSLRVGGLNNPTSLTEGVSIFLDNVETRRQNFIGGTCN
jgi:hypothetical protein